MQRMTDYDYLCTCYKLKAQYVGNAVQQLGKLEDRAEMMDYIIQRTKEKKYEPEEALTRIIELWEGTDGK